jgi:magnesium-transporting ATPase (P-type)
VKRATEAVEEAKAARERGVSRKNSALYRGTSVTIGTRHHFSSALGRMSVVAHVKGFKADKGASAEDVVLCLVKGSPEAVGPLISHGKKPEWFDTTYTHLAEQGLRVLALAYKRVPHAPASAAAGLAASSKLARESVESDLTFGGFLAFGCAVRQDSASVRALRTTHTAPRMPPPRTTPATATHHCHRNCYSRRHDHSPWGVSMRDVACV